MVNINLITIKFLIMFFAIFILIRILFVACMVFIIGHVFGNFSKKPALRTITKVASVIVVLLFISMNVILFRSGHWHHNDHSHWDNYQKDSTINK